MNGMYEVAICRLLFSDPILYLVVYVRLWAAYTIGFQTYGGMYHILASGLSI